eukprot:970586-Alexandrium_andersonii.AAC.1
MQYRASRSELELRMPRDGLEIGRRRGSATPEAPLCNAPLRNPRSPLLLARARARITRGGG